MQLQTMFYAVLTLAAVACATDMPRLPVLEGTEADHASTSFPAAAKLCGTHVSLAGLVTETNVADAGRAIALTVEHSVCGGDTTIDGASWKAIAVGTTTQLVALNGVEADAKLFLQADNSITARSSSGDTKVLGKVDAADEGMPVALAAGVSAQILVEGKAFVLGKAAKDAPGRVAAFSAN